MRIIIFLIVISSFLFGGCSSGKSDSGYTVIDLEDAMRNNNEYIKLSLSDSYKDNVINIPLYVAAPGNYVLEPVIFTGKDGYHISENVVFDAK